MARRGRRYYGRRPPVTVGLDPALPVADLIDEITQRLIDRWNEDHRHNPLATMTEEAAERIYERADTIAMNLIARRGD